MNKIRVSHSAPSFACIAALVVGWWAVAAGAANEPSPAQRALIEIGHRIYEDGILPDGGPLRGVYPEGFVLQGAQAACATCHRRSGYGSFEGSVMVAPIAGAVLFEPAPYFIKAGSTPTGADATVPWYRAMSRSAYDEATLARAIREGLDPDGDQLMPPMPRFALNDQAFSALLAYLRRLSADPSPGIEPGTLHLATVIAPDAPSGAADAVIGVLQAWAARQPSEMRWDLHVWRLSGAPGGWEAQLEEDYRQRPVFALLSGAGAAEWAPVHRFCERVKVACVLPSLEAAPEPARQDLYSVYFSPGVTLEAKLLARHLQSVGTASEGARHIVQVYADASGKRAAETLRPAFGASPNSISVRKLHRIAPAAALAGLSAADILILWLRPSDIAALVARSPQGPPAGQVFLSALLAPPKMLSLPPSWKARVSYVSLFDDWDPKVEPARVWLDGWLERVGLPKADMRIQADAYGASYFFTVAFARMQKERNLWRTTTLNRDYLLENLESVVAKNTGDPMDVNAYVPFYGRLSLASGQRIAAKGGHIVRYVSPDSEKRVPIEGP